MTNEELEKARSYAIDKMRYSELHSIFNEIETTVNDRNGYLPWIDSFFDNRFYY